MNPPPEQPPPLRDAFEWYCRMDMATTLAARGTGGLSDDQAREIARGIQAVIHWGEQHPQQRPSDYLELQALLFQHAGPGASRMHAGRSRQDMLATLHRLLLRDRILLLLQGLQQLRAAFIEKGRAFETVVVPTYTNGVQAQPALFGHLMCGYEAPLARNTRRCLDCFPRLNLSPLGAAALATSRFHVDRHQIATLLGFATFVDNAFDAAQLGIVDTGVECANIASLTALNLNMFIQDLHAQFHHARPWITLAAPGLSSPSTLMPQKRNPVVLNRARLLGSEVLGAAMTAAMAAHNVCSGLTDYKRMDAAKTLDTALLHFRETLSVLQGIDVHPLEAMEELRAEYACASELAAILQETTDIPLALTHAFCSRLVDVARSERLALADLPPSTLCKLFADTLREKGVHPPPPFPLSPAEYQTAVDPVTMVNNYRGCGGSSPGEVSRMLASASVGLEDDQNAIFNLTNSINVSAAWLDQEFRGLLPE